MSIAATDDEPEPDGETLRDRLLACQQEGLSGIPAAELVCHVWDVASFLDALHAQGQTHRDVKPDTIRIVNGRALLADAKPVQTPSGDVTFAGTPAYVAPEAWGGRLGPKSDQYSLACSYAELRLGRLPLFGADFVAIMRAHLSAKPDLAGLARAERRVVLRALSKDPASRYPTCRDFAQDLQRTVCRGR